MKHKAEDSIFKKKGFFIALYSCLGAVAVLAMVITFFPFGGDPYGEDAHPVGADTVLPYQQQAEADPEAWFRPRPTPTPPPPMPTPAPQAPGAATPPPRVPAAPVPPTAPSAPTPPDGTITPNGEPIPGPTSSQPTPAASPVPPATGQEYYEVPHIAVAPVPATFNPFTANDRMIWPVEGDIAMDFDLYTLVYDPTLDRFAVNDDIRITAQEGTPVRAGADGRILSVGSNVRYGNYVMVDHGNGWVARYGQLMDAVMVNEGDVIRTGQVIGGVGQPSYFGTMLGTHLNFRLTRDGGVIDPHTVLAERG